MYLWRDSCLGRDTYKEFTYIYGGIHIEGGIHISSSDVCMEGLIFRKGFIQGVHMYLWQDSYVGKDPYKVFTCIYAGIHLGSSHTSIEGFISGVLIYLWRDSYIGKNSYEEFTCIYGKIRL